MKKETLVLVNDKDEPIGYMEKMKAHEEGLLHRAFSVFIFNSEGKMLLQKRSAKKYHGGGLWTNACCSHPKPDENVKAAAEKRLFEEMGFTTTLKKVFEFTYLANVENGLIEHEYDHVFSGIYEGEINPDRMEVEDYCYKDMDTISLEVSSRPEDFTSWFKIAFPKIRGGQ
ncbi:MAG TPA: isopentenyl-diphosphate Delta-isomerase [Flavisolibacter sp.]|jgi:isopentenyl-diphosphate delta-isomerase|nr:isopentenyl-diphosphate Delta-isomerase [Flavisolibacter sp.]